MKAVLIVGATSGIGGAITRSFAKKGYQLVMAAAFALTVLML